jgi:hypothetical protein
MRPDCFADEIAIDFPHMGQAVERMRAAFLGQRLDDDVVRTELMLSGREAAGGFVAPVDVPIRGTCPRCGGRGETWTERCKGCSGTGESLFHRRIRVVVPRGVVNGARFRFRLSSSHAASVRVEVRVAIRPLNRVVE